MTGATRNGSFLRRFTDNYLDQKYAHTYVSLGAGQMVGRLEKQRW